MQVQALASLRAWCECKQLSLLALGVARGIQVSCADVDGHALDELHVASTCKVLNSLLSFGGCKRSSEGEIGRPAWGSVTLDPSLL